MGSADERDGSSDPSAATRFDPLEAVARAAASGDAAATRRLVVELAPAVLRMVRRVLGPTHPDVEDHAQETLVGVIRALPQFRFECSVVHFAVGIAVRRVTAARRRSRAVLGWLDRFRRHEEPLHEEAGDRGDPAVADRKRRMLDALLRELPEAQAETMLLRVALGLSLEEIAAATSTPLNTVRSRLRLAKEALRRRIESDPRWLELGALET